MTTNLSKEKQLSYIQIQQEELEVLESIYLHDMKIIKSSPPFKFEVICRPFLSSFDEVSDSQYNLRIIVEFVKNYPDKAPIIEFEPLTNITQDNVCEIEMTTQKILDKINGTPILYEFVETARGWIHYNLIDRVEDEIVKAQEAKTKRKVYDTYTPVTLETFTIWKQKFSEEMNLIKQEQQKYQQKEIIEFNKKTTGEEYFQNLIKTGQKIEEDVQDGDDCDDDEFMIAGEDDDDEEDDEDYDGEEGDEEEDEDINWDLD